MFKYAAHIVSLPDSAVLKLTENSRVTWRAKTPALGILERGPWEFQNVHLADLEAASAPASYRLPRPASKPLPALQVAHSEERRPLLSLPGTPQAVLGQKMGQNGPKEGPSLGNLWQCPAPLWASVSPRGQDIHVPKCPLPHPSPTLTICDFLPTPSWREGAGLAAA